MVSKKQAFKARMKSYFVETDTSLLGGSLWKVKMWRKVNSTWNQMINAILQQEQLTQRKAPEGEQVLSTSIVIRRVEFSRYSCFWKHSIHNIHEFIKLGTTCLEPWVSGCIHPLIGGHGKVANLWYLSNVRPTVGCGFGIKQPLFFDNLGKVIFAPDTTGSRWGGWPRAPGGPPCRREKPTGGKWAWFEI